MEILVGTDRQVPGREELLSFIGFEVLAGLGPCASRVSNVHVHLSAETGGRIGPVSMRCRLASGRYCISSFTKISRSTPQRA